MKYFAIIIALFTAQAMASERVNIVCAFDAVASGYTSKFYSTNLILNDDHFFNDDGNSGYNGKAIFGNGDDALTSNFEFGIYDGNKYHKLYAFSGLSFNKLATWSLNTGNVSCTMTRGWHEEYYSEF